MIKKFICISDIHGNHVDHRAFDKMIKFAKDFKADYSIINGDLFDFAALRRGASDDEIRESIHDDVQIGLDCADRFFRASPKSKKVFLLGNHDERIYDFIKPSTPALLKEAAIGLEEEIMTPMREWGVEVIRYRVDTWYQVGKLKFNHGFSHGKTAATNMARTYGNVIFGHSHGISSYRNDSHKAQTAFNQGCLCRLDPSYALRNLNTLRWEHGFTYGIINEDTGYFEVNQARYGKDYHLVTATKFKEY